MSQRFRFWIAGLLCLSLGGQAGAIANLHRCHGAAKSGLAALTASFNHSMLEGESKPHGPQHHSHHRSPQSAIQGDTDSPSASPEVKRCAVCASCCHVSVLTSTATDRVTGFGPAAATFPAIVVPRLRNVAAGLERPPRS